MDISPDESIYITRAIDIINANKLSTVDQSPVYFYIVDIGYKLFGVNIISSRLPNILFGSFIIFLIYLIGKHIFNKKVGLIAALLYALSAYSIIWMVEPDMIAAFFILASFYFYITALDGKKEKFILSFLFLGVGTLIKTTVIISLVAYFIYYVYYSIKNPHKVFSKREGEKLRINKKIMRIWIISFALLALLMSPIMVYNYLLYKEKDLLDGVIGRYDFITKHLKSYDKSIYEDTAAEGWSWGAFKSGSIEMTQKFLRQDPIIFLLFIIGIVFSLLTKKRFTWLILWLMLIPSIFLFGSSSLSVHFVFLFPFFCLYAALFITWLSTKLKKRNALIIMIILFVLIQYTLVSIAIPKTASIIKLRKQVSSIPDDALVITDSRIYRGKVAWAFNDKHYVEVIYWDKIISPLNSINEEPVYLQTYFIECVDDDCGRGQGMKDDVEQQQANEAMITEADRNAKNKKTIKGSDFTFTIYENTIKLKPSVLKLADKTQGFHYYPLRWRNPEGIFDYYEAEGFDKLPDLIAHLILYISIFIAIISPFLINYFSKKYNGHINRENENVTPHTHNN